jgi:hypothetical protein
VAGRVKGAPPLRQANDTSLDMADRVLTTSVEICERRAGATCADRECGHRQCWLHESKITELTLPARWPQQPARHPAQSHAGLRSATSDRSWPGPPTGPTITSKHEIKIPNLPGE